MRINPWLAVVVISIGVVAAVAFEHWHVDAATIPTAIVTVGISILAGFGQARTQERYEALRKSMRPPNPSRPDRENTEDG